MDIAQAYNMGVNYLENAPARAGIFNLSGFLKQLGSQNRNDFYLLPLAVAGHRLQNGSGVDNTSKWPTFADLTKTEIGAVSYLLEYILADTSRKVDMAVARPWLQDSLLGLRYLKGLPIPLRQLPKLDQPFDSDPLNPVLAGIDVVRTIIARGVKKGVEPFAIATDDDNFFQWLDGQRDPKMWHQIASGGLNWDVAENMDTIAWIIAQPECDPATAAGLFLNLDGQDIVGLPVKEAVQSAYAATVVEICQKAETFTAKPKRLALADFGLKNDQSKWAPKLDALYEERAVSGVNCVPSPSALFATPYKGRRSTGWSVHSETYIMRDI